MIYFKSKYLSDRLDINLAKWKRWSREFLTPDPLGGYRSGVARQFSFKDAFRVFLGGYLVGVLNFTIPQARRILVDLNQWLKKNRFYTWPKPIDRPGFDGLHWIYVYQTDGRYCYAIRSVTGKLSRRKDGRYEEIFSLELIGLSQEQFPAENFSHACVINIDKLHYRFLKQLNSK